MTVITTMHDIPSKLRQGAATAVVQAMIRCRRSRPLSEAILETDPDGTLILRRSDYDRISFGMGLDEVIAIIGSPPYREDRQKLEWYTLGGSLLSITVTWEQPHTVIGKSFNNVIAGGCKIEPYFDGVLLDKNGSKCQLLNGDQHRWPLLSSADIAKYFLRFSNAEQTAWFQQAMNGVVRFRMKKVAGEYMIQNEFEGQQPDLSAQTLSRCNSDARVNMVWKSILEIGSSQALTIRNRLMRAVDACHYFCTEDERRALLTYVQGGDYIAAEEFGADVHKRLRANKIAVVADLVTRREEEGPIYGRDYKKKEEGDLWGWYKYLIYDRDAYRCQYCGV
ncbi:MAG: hypothetical protein HQ518_02185, partial [Rhodopirellula sp.]|nr:hypothetical protein [Rhodopirellula sp.]